jgi:DNA-binding MarR family transcriptional regulator
VDRALAPLDLTHAQYVLLASLLGLGNAGIRPTQRELADHTGLEPLYVSKLSRALESAGLLRRTPDPADSRAVRLDLTPRGEESTERAVVVVHTLMDRHFAPLGGLGSKATADFVRDLTTLLAATD